MMPQTPTAKTDTLCDYSPADAKKDAIEKDPLTLTKKKRKPHIKADEKKLRSGSLHLTHKTTNNDDLSAMRYSAINGGPTTPTAKTMPGRTQILT